MSNIFIYLFLSLILLGIGFIISILTKRNSKIDKTPSAQIIENSTVAFDVIEKSLIPPTTPTISADEADIILSAAGIEDGESDDPGSSIELSKIEPILRAIPSLTTLAASSTKVFRLSFSPEITKGLAEGKFSLMKSADNLKAIAIDKTGKIVGQGNITADRLMTSVAVISAAWQILAIVTAQKFLSDINKKLASIEEGVKRLETWLQTREQGNYLGNMRYIGDLSQNLARELSPEEAVIIKNQLESIYRESIQSIETNSLRAQAAIDALLSKSFNGSLEENQIAFTRDMEAYFGGVSYVIKFQYVAAMSEYMSAVIDGKPNREINRIRTIHKESELLLEQVKMNTESMKAKSLLVKGGFFDREIKIKEARNKLLCDLEKLLNASTEATSKIASVSISGNQLHNFRENTEKIGLQVIIQLSDNGELKTVTHIKSKKPA